MATPSPEDIDFFRSMHGQGPQGTRISLILGVEISMITLAVGVVALRFYARTVIKRALGWDDWFMFASTAVAFINTIISCVSTKYGMGKHAWSPTLNDINVREGSKLGWVYSVLFTPAVTLSKISILLTYLRIFPAKKDRLFCFCLLGYLVTYGVIVTIIVACQCRPVNGYWDLSIKNKQCMNQKAAMMTTSSLNSLSDLLVFLWPAPKLWDVALPKRQRVGLIIVFSLGCVVCIAGIVRIAYYPTFFGSKDVFWEAAIITVSSAIECDLAVICGSLPEIRPLVLRLIRKSSGETAPSYFSDARDSLEPDGGFHRHSSQVKLPDERDSFDKACALGKVKGFGEEKSIAMTSNSSQERMKHNDRQRGSDATHDSEATWVNGEEIVVVYSQNKDSHSAV